MGFSRKGVTEMVFTRNMGMKSGETSFTELWATTNFSFLRGGSHPEEFFEHGRFLGYRALGVADYTSFAGIVRCHTAAKENGIQFLAGVRLELLTDDFPLTVLVYPPSRESYGRLCTLLSMGKQRAKRDGCLLTLLDFYSLASDLVVVAIPPKPLESYQEALEKTLPHENIAATSEGILLLEEKEQHSPSSAERYQRRFESFKSSLSLLQRAYPYSLSLALQRSYFYNAYRYERAVIALSQELQIPLVATNAPLCHRVERRMLVDTLSCIRRRIRIEELGIMGEQNSERYLKHPDEMLRLFRDLPEALKRTEEIRRSLEAFSLDQITYEYPESRTQSQVSPHQELCHLVFEGARRKYPQGIPLKIQTMLSEELRIIEELRYEKYFLTCHTIVQFARSRGILCQGRGSAANSVVCFCLEITAVDPEQIDVLFARFVSKERSEPPDIDIDFEHSRREEVIQFIYETFGREHAALTAEVVSYRHRSALRDVAKVFGFSEEVIDSLAKSVHRWSHCDLSATDIEALGLSAHDKNLRRTLLLAQQLYGFPRHLSQHVGGFIISKEPLTTIVPIRNATMEGRTIIEWDKDDIEALQILKIDILALGMLTCIRKAFKLIEEKQDKNVTPLSLYNLPREDPKVYEMISRADTVGVFQIESRAQMSMLPRLKPKTFYDLVIEVAIVRPGPIQGKMVHPYLRRRNGHERVFYPDEKVKEILGKTMGVPLFQEQAMRLAILLANFTPGEAEELRRAMAAWKRNSNKIKEFQERIITGMCQNGYSKEFAESCLKQIQGFSEYGFPESHAASFAYLVYASAWIKYYYPAHFAAALLNSQPMGFYGPSQIVRDAKDHSVSVLPVDIMFSDWECTIESNTLQSEALRLGFNTVKGLRRGEIERIVTFRNESDAFSLKKLGKGSFAHFLHLFSSLQSSQRGDENSLRRQTLLLLARADCFRSFGLSRREALWEIQALPKEPKRLDVYRRSKREQIALPALSPGEAMLQDYERTSLSLRSHPFHFLRQTLTERGVLSSEALKKRRKNTTVLVAGLVLFRQRPGTAKGVVFLTLEDEFGVVNIIVPPALYEKYRVVLLKAPLIMAAGKLDFIGPVLYLQATHLEEIEGRGLFQDRKREMFGERSYSY